ncbi:MAG: (4Fe-4S)-binding protein [Bacteroidia bacterium]|nr:(4Fe-4S)-binding protein [Bacteroidia bacterium]
MEKETTIQYKNDNITVFWKPHMCIHSKLCWQQLGEVFKPKERPWVKIDGATTEQITTQINKCPSGALSYRLNSEINNTSSTKTDTTVEIITNGPMLIHGNIVIKKEGEGELKKDKTTAFCRCGQSANKPYCDGTHNKVNFKD